MATNFIDGSNTDTVNYRTESHRLYYISLYRICWVYSVKEYICRRQSAIDCIIS
jgi:hypothetical protein